MSHTIARAKARYGLDLAWSDLDELKRAAFRDEPWVEFVQHLPDNTYPSNVLAEYVGFFRGNWIVFVVSRTTGYVVTFLPPHLLGLVECRRAADAIARRLGLRSTA